VKEADLVRVILESRIKYYRTITYTLLCIVAICILTLAGTFYFPSHQEKEITTLFISLTSGLFGALVTIITQGIQAARKLKSDEELQEEVHKINSEEPKPPPEKPILP
jgi:TRAP-type C4-dicarboxylate transport system permease small subunit